MSQILGQLNPTAVFQYFEEITQIPHESGNEEKISAYLVEFANQHGLEVVQEPCYNVIIKKPATAGYEQAPKIILQGHMDMVCVKEDESDFDFASQPLPIYVDGDYIRTRGTTLGADNGIALAMMMAILTDKTLQHPELTVLVTAEEETGMDGVMALNPDHVSGDILINLDSEEEGVALASCAGGVRNTVSLPIEWSDCLSSDNETYEIIISGLKGGHSGVEIDKNRANSNKLLGRLLADLNKQLKVSVAHVAGGEKMNAIPKRAVAKVMISSADVKQLKLIVETFEKMVQDEFALADPGIKVSMNSVQNVEKVFSTTTLNHLIAILQLMPYGPQTMSEAVKGLVESSNNIGVLETTDQTIEFNSAVRSSVGSLKTEINHRIQTIADLTGATMTLTADYPEWQFANESKIREIMSSVYAKLTNKELEVTAIHAGLECGFLSEKLGAIDMISIGPEMHDVHTPKECLSISSTERVYDFLCAVLKEVK